MSNEFDICRIRGIMLIVKDWKLLGVFMIKFFKKLRLRTKIILIITTLVVGAAGGFGAYILTEANKAPAEIEESDAKFQIHQQHQQQVW